VSVGSQPNFATLNAMAAQLAVAQRNNAVAILQLWTYVNQNNTGVANMVAAGADSDDATQFVDLVDQMATVAQVYQGTATQAAAYGFASALTALTGPS
jgi:hypothetical protein